MKYAETRHGMRDFGAPTARPTRTLGKTGIEARVLGVGCAWVGRRADGSIDAELARESWIGCDRRGVGRLTPREGKIGAAESVLDLVWLFTASLFAWLRPRQDLVLENLLRLRHQLAVLTRPTRARPGARHRTWDKLLWVLARRCVSAGASI